MSCKVQRGAVTARGWLLAAVAALAARPLAANPDRVDCSRSIASGAIMFFNQHKRCPCADPARKGGHYGPVRRCPDDRRHGAHACQRKHWLAIPDRGGNVSGLGFVGHHLRLLQYAKGRKQVLYYAWSRAGDWRAERASACVCMCDWHACTHHTVTHGDANHRLILCCWFVAADSWCRLVRAASPIPSLCHRRELSQCG